MNEIMAGIWAQVAEAKEEMEIANANFNHAIERDVIDYWTYRIKSAQTKYGNLLKQMRELKASAANSETLAEVSSNTEKAG